jgi:hypothetical protein
MILVLATPRGRANGLLFGVGWLAGLAILDAVVLALAGPAGASEGGEPAAWTGRLKLLLGVLGAAAGGAAVARPPRPGGGTGDAQVDGEHRQAPARRGAGPRRPPVRGHPKNAALTIAAAATIAGAGLPGREQAVVLAVFVLIGSVGVLAPLVVYLFAGEGAARTLDSWKTWAATNNAAVLAVLFLVFGFKLVGDGIAVLF